MKHLLRFVIPIVIVAVAAIVVAAVLMMKNHNQHTIPATEPTPNSAATGNQAVSTAAKPSARAGRRSPRAPVIDNSAAPQESADGAKPTAADQPDKTPEELAREKREKKLEEEARKLIEQELKLTPEQIQAAQPALERLGTVGGKVRAVMQENEELKAQAGPPEGLKPEQQAALRLEAQRRFHAAYVENIGEIVAALEGLRPYLDEQQRKHLDSGIKVATEFAITGEIDLRISP